MKAAAITAVIIYTNSNQAFAKKSYDYEYKCPFEYELNKHHGICTKRITTDSSSRCPHGYNLTEKDECVKFDIIPVERVKKFEDLIHSCPKNYDEFRSQCRKKTKKERDFECPVGYHKDDQEIKCTKVSTSSPKLVCPTGSVEEDGKCMRKETQPLQEGGSRTEKVGVEWRCPEGTWVSGSDRDRCEKKQYFADPERICEGERIHDGCGWRERMGKQIVCPAYFHRSQLRAADGGELCEKCGNKGHKETSGCEYKAARRGCTDGFQNTGEQCEKIHWKDFKYVCPRGGHVDRHNDGAVKCTSFGIVDKFKYCPHGFTRHGKECVKHVPVAGTCPEGFEQFVMICKRVVHVDFELKCEDHLTLREGVCVGKEDAEDAIYSRCPRGSTASGKFCVSFDYSERIATCPAGYKSGKGSCYKLGEKTCPVGYEELIQNGDRVCVMKSVRDLDESCPNGFYPDGPGQCSRVDEVDATKKYVKREPTYEHRSHFGHHW